MNKAANNDITSIDFFFSNSDQIDNYGINFELVAEKLQLKSSPFSSKSAKWSFMLKFIKCSPLLNSLKLWFRPLIQKSVIQCLSFIFQILNVLFKFKES